MAILTIMTALSTIAVSWLSWRVYQVYRKGVQLAPIPGPPPPPGILNAILGNIQDISRNQTHRMTTEWSERYGGLCHLRFLHTHVSPLCVKQQCVC